MSQLIQTWNRFKQYPGGRWCFNMMIRMRIPYTGSIRPVVIKLEPGHAEVLFADRRAVRNHLRSVHAIALINAAEFSTGLAMMSSQPDSVRSILTGLSIEYLKKARGPITAICDDSRGPLSDDVEREERTLISELHNREGQIVARAEAQWLLDHGSKG